jgi:thiol-disulfide isomerase/thioredoxin
LGGGRNRVDIAPGTNPSLDPDCLLLCYIPAMHTPPNLVRNLLASALFALCLSVCANLDANTKPKEPAPHFNAKSTSGESFSNASIKGKVVLLEFWTTWCGYCRAEAPFVEKINHEYTEKDFIVLAINVGESRKTVKKYLDQNPRTCRIVLTEDTNLAAMYAATAYPIYVVIDREGNIAGTQRGAAGEDALRSLLARAGLGPDPDADSE